MLFGADLELDPSVFGWPNTFPFHELSSFGIVGDVLGRGGYLTGMVLLATGDGHLHDDVIWLLAANPDPTQPRPHSLDRIRGAVRGWRRAADLAPLVDNVAAAVAWGAWREPPQAPDIPADPRHRALHKALTHNAVRVRERRGALVGVRVLDLGRSLARGGQAAVAHDQPPARRASPVPHLRSGHFRRVRVGPRASFHYEIRWIPPVWVQGDTDRAAERLVVRRLPPPATWSQAPSRQPRPAIVGDERAFPTGPAADRPPPHDHDLRQGPHDDPFDIDIP